MAKVLDKIVCHICASTTVPNSVGYRCYGRGPEPRYDCIVGGTEEKDGKPMKCNCSDDVRKAGCRCCAICRCTNAWWVQADTKGLDGEAEEKCWWCEHPVYFSYSGAVEVEPEDHLSDIEKRNWCCSDCDGYGRYNRDTIYVKSVNLVKLHDLVEKEIIETRKMQRNRNWNIRRETRCSHYIKLLCRECRKSGDDYDCKYREAWEDSYESGKERCPCFGSDEEPDPCRTCRAITTSKVVGDLAGTSSGDGDRCKKCDAPVTHTYDPMQDDDNDDYLDDESFSLATLHDRSFDSLHQLVEDQKRLQPTKGGG